MSHEYKWVQLLPLQTIFLFFYNNNLVNSTTTGLKIYVLDIKRFGIRTTAPIIN